VPRRDLERLTHLVLVDGRLVDMWSEPVRGTEWEHHARRHDAERLPPAPLPTPPHQRVLEWLDATCGDRAAVLALDDRPLVGDGLGLPTTEVPAHRARLEESAAALDLVAERWFDAEVAVALRRALLRVWADDATVVTTARSAHVVAGGTCWAVGRANGLFRPGGAVTMQRVRDTLDSAGTLSSWGGRVRTALLGFRGWPADHQPRPSGVPDLQPLGHADLLVSGVRRDLVRLRDRALDAAG
jgi:hypothetical protein